MRLSLLCIAFMSRCWGYPNSQKKNNEEGQCPIIMQIMPIAQYYCNVNWIKVWWKFIQFDQTPTKNPIIAAWSMKHKTIFSGHPQRSTSCIISIKANVLLQCTSPFSSDHLWLPLKFIWPPSASSKIPVFHKLNLSKMIVQSRRT